MKFKHFFALGLNFLDPQTSKDGKPYGPKRFKDIVEECWFISDNINTSYTEILDISFQERIFLIECIRNKQENTKKAIEEVQQRQSSHK